MTTTDITPSQLNILIYLTRFRFLNTRHFQSLFNHKDPKRIKEWLKDLTQKQYIQSNYQRTYGQINIPAVFCLLTKSRKILKQLNKYDIKILDRIYSEKSRSKQFQYHSLFIGNIYIELKKNTKSPKTLQFFTQTDIQNYDSLPETKPQAYIVVKSPDQKTQRYFLEVFDQGEPFYDIKERIKDYIAYYQEDKWQEVSKDPLPSIILIFRGEKIKNEIYSHIVKVLKSNPEVKLSFFVASKQKILAEGLNPGVWTKVIIKKEN